MKNLNSLLCISLLACATFSSCAKKKVPLDRADSSRNSERAVDDQRPVVTQIEEIQTSKWV